MFRVVMHGWEAITEKVHDSLFIISSISLGVTTNGFTGKCHQSLHLFHREAFPKYRF